MAAPPEKARREIRRRLDGARAFLARGLWTAEPRGGLRRFAYAALRTGVLVWEGFARSDFLLLAGALTFKVVFALVPLLVVMLAVLKGFGGLSSAAEQVKTFVLRYMTPDVGNEIAGRINEFVENINGAAIGLVGLLILLYSALSLFDTTEKAFNSIWGVRRPRPLLRRFTLYWTLLTVAPICVALSLSASTFLESQALYRWLGEHVPYFSAGVLKLAPFVFSCAFFTGLYLFMPNTEVKFLPALAGGALAGVAWELMKKLYVWYNVNVMTSNQFYGSLAAVPVFLLWVYLSWLIVLVGCEFVFAVQNARTYKRELDAPRVSPEFRERMALLLMMDITRDFIEGRKPPSSNDLASRLNVPVRLVHDLAGQLESQGLVHGVGGSDSRSPGLVPAQDPGELTVGHVLEVLHRYGDAAFSIPDGPTFRRVRQVVEEARERYAEPLRHVTLRDLAAPNPGGGDGTGPPAAS